MIIRGKPGDYTKDFCLTKHKKASKLTDFLYALMDKGYLNPEINAYAGMIGRRVIIDQRTRRGKAALPMDKADANRYKARSTVERSNSELKDGFLPDKIYRRGSHARYDIEMAVLMTTMKKVWKMLLLKEEHLCTENHWWKELFDNLLRFLERRLLKTQESSKEMQKFLE